MTLDEEIAAVQAQLDAAIARDDYKQTLHLALMLSAMHAERSAIARRKES